MSEAAALLEGKGHGGHAHGVDPHWWNSVENMQRAAGVVGEAFGRADPGNAAVYEANAAGVSKKLGELRESGRGRRLVKIPAGQRKLATAHFSLGYFAQEFGFKLIPVQGLNPEVPATSQELAGAMDTIRRSKVRALFPEQGVNPKHLELIAAETGVAFGGQLIADGNGTGALAGFAGAFEHNIREIVKAQMAPEG